MPPAARGYLGERLTHTRKARTMPPKTKPDHSRNLAPWEINAVIDRLLYYIQPEERTALMADMPKVYNKLIGDAVVEVTLIKYPGT